MTADEFRTMLDRFHWGLTHVDGFILKNTASVPRDWDWRRELKNVWRDLNRECALMKDAERPCVACELGSPGGLPGSEDVAVFPSTTEVNAEQIGTLQAKVAQLEGTLKAIAKTTAEAFEMVDDERTMRAMMHMDKMVESLEAPATIPESPPHPSIVSGFPPWEDGDGKDGSVPDMPAHSHKDSGLRCLAAHGDGHGNQQPPCIQCKRCGEWIRPEAMGQTCPGKQPIEGDGWSGESPPGNDKAVFDAGPDTPPHPKGEVE